MAKLLMIVERNGNGLINSVVKDIDTISRNLIPDNIAGNQTRVIQNGSLAYFVFNPVQTIHVQDTSVCLGHMANIEHEWWLPGSGIPDGTFALFRTNNEVSETISDKLASRTIWYYSDINVFIAATSQRAIIMCLKSFHFNDENIPWMLFSGITGPGLSWDRRIKSLPLNSTLTLNRRTWEINISSKPVIYLDQKQTYQQNLKQFDEILTDVLSRSDLDLNKWILTLSGGYDSRGLLLYLKEKPALRAITWGTASSETTKINDAIISRAITDFYGIPHTYYTTDRSNEKFNIVLGRFLGAGEGRIEHIGAYMDGMKIWSTLFGENYEGVIRGDHTFGYRKLLNYNEVINSLSIKTIQSFGNTSEFNSFGLPEQRLPDYFTRNEGESFCSWRDRLFTVFRIPAFMAALNDIKLSYTEVYSPFMTSRVVDFIRSLPDDLRTNKKLLKDLIKKKSPDIPFTKYEAILTHSRVVQEFEIARFLKEEITGIAANSILPNRLLNHIADRILLNPDKLMKRSAWILTYQKIRNSMPSRVKFLIKKSVPKPGLDFNLLAFRALIIHRMNALLSKDSLIAAKKQW
ncbi:MAG: hypothetical protein JW830_03125 [Bacteroidales bacterium]|nr:hypothetical protein [Bacteroidales bacterium]